jgi:CHAT domain-containing protein/Tfp pilus assembly protein PilF
MPHNRVSFFVVVILILTATRVLSISSSSIDRKQDPKDPSEITLLEQGKAIEREIKGGESHTFQVNLSAGQFLNAAVEQNGIELGVTIFDPANKELIDIKMWKCNVGRAPINWIADGTGTYRLKVYPTNKEANTGRYSIKVEEIRTAGDEDRIRVSAQAAFVEAYRLNSKGGKEFKTKAIEKLSEATSKYKTLADKFSEGYTLQFTGQIYDFIGERKKALEHFNQSLLLLRQVGDRSGEASTLNYMGLVYDSMGEKQKALDYFNQSLPLFKQLEDRNGEALVLNNIGRLYDTLGEKQKALDYFNQSLPLFKQLGNRSGEATTLNNIGLVYFTLGDRQKALDYYNQALVLRKQVGDRSGEASTLNNIAIIHFRSGDRKKTLELLEQALVLRRQVGDVAGETITLNNIGAIYDNLGEKQKALDYFNQALPLRKKLGDRSGEATTLTNMGVLYDNLGEKQKALDYYNRALPLRRQAGDRMGEAITLINLSRVYDFLEERQKALECLDQALLLNRQLNDRNGEANTLNAIGRVYDNLGEKQKAIDYFNQVLSLHRQGGDRAGEANALTNLGYVYSSLGEKEKAHDHYNQALQLHRQVGNRENEAVTLLNIAKLENEQDNLAGARTIIESAIKNVEYIRTSVAGQDLRSSFFQTIRNYYELYVDILMRSHKANPKDDLDSLALQASERSRARSLVELLGEAKIDIREGVDAKLLEREKGLRQLINEKADALLKLKNRKNTEEQAAQLEKEVNSLISEREEVENQIRAASPKYAALSKPEAISFKDIQQLLDADTLLLEYSLGEKRSYLWLVSQTSLTVYELPARKLIEDKAREFYSFLTLPIRDTQATNTDYKKSASELGSMLLGQAEKDLGKKRLLIVAEGALQYIPFAALSMQTSSYTPLILDHEIANIPSVSTLAVQRRELANRPAAGKLLAVIADPVFDQNDPRLKQVLSQRETGEKLAQNIERSIGEELEQSKLLRSVEESGVTRDGGFSRLIGSRREAITIASLAEKGKVLKALDFDASRDTATSEELSKYRFIHIATHGLLNSKNPELSGIVLSLVDKDGKQQRGFLKLNEIYNLKLNAELVVLSGCQTGLGKEIRGEGLVGLTRGFMYAGARSVVASLWNVQDLTTSDLMVSFYQAMLKGGKKPAEALRLAQIEMFKKARKSNPYYWAGFTFQGDWR